MPPWVRTGCHALSTFFYSLMGSTPSKADDPTMTTTNEKIDLDGVRRSAVHREIRKVDQRTEEQERVAQKLADLATYKAELFLKVQEHVNDLEKLQCKKEDLTKFKAELLLKAEAHLKEMEASELKSTEIESFKGEMMKRVQERMEEAEKAQRKAAESATYKDEMLAKAEQLARTTV
jgi:hypothetical protein